MKLYFMSPQNYNIKEESRVKTICKGKASSIFSAQERNKRSVCNKSKNNFSPDKRDELIRKYVYLVNWVVNRLPMTSLREMDRDDLIGYGTLGLIEAVDRFDPDRSSSFESFAIARIRGSIYDQLRAADWLSRGSRKKVKDLFKASSKLENELGRYPTNKELASELSISLEELRVIQGEAQIGIFSLDEPRDSQEDNNTFIDTVSSNSTPVLEDLEENELKERLTKAVDALPEREKTVVGLYHYKKLTFKEIAEIMDFSESRASQIHARAISLLK